MRIVLTLLVLLPLSPAMLHGQSIDKTFPKSVNVRIKNPVSSPRDNVMVQISIQQLRKAAPLFNSKAFVVLRSGQEIPSQYVGNAGGEEGIAFILDKVDASESVNVLLRYNADGEIKRKYVKRTQAELSRKTGGKFVNREYIGGTFENVQYLRVPSEHKDHSWYLRYEGPGWESDKVGYRLYLDQRNAIDVFGKKTAEMILQGVGQDGFDSYHELQPWGMDVMKVGNSLGLGSVGYLVDRAATRVEKTDSVSCRVSDNGDIYSSLTIKYNGWNVGSAKFNLTSHLSIHAGSELTHHRIAIKDNAKSLCTGIVKDPKGKLQFFEGDKDHFGYIATYGQQSLNNDNLGLVIFFAPGSSNGFAEDEFSHILKLKVEGGKTEYYFMALWAGSPGGVAEESKFYDRIREVSAQLAHPVEIHIGK